ncbi:hypothetical protein AC844P1_00006 [Anaerostipes phage AC844P1]|nr:hypothetical protein AC844P1_00006 [Anaerostipes phage AC844P1]
MDRKTLRQYRSLKKEQKDLDHKLNKLYDRGDAIPEVFGKVTGSSQEFPYTEVHPTVVMAEPVASDNVQRLIRAKKNRKNMVDKVALEIEQFIQRIPDSRDRSIFEMVYIDGIKQKDVAEQFRYTKGRMSQIISKYLKD